jgi:hypothetical protein
VTVPARLRGRRPRVLVLRRARTRPVTRPA